MGLIDNINFQIFLFQLALVQTFKQNLRKRFWSDVQAKNVAHLSQRFLKGYLFTEYESNDALNISYNIYIDYESASVIITFPGSSNHQQVRRYLTLKETKMPWAPDFTAQTGFLDLYRTIQVQLKVDMKRVLAECAGFSLIFNGWSLGGSLCRIAAWDFLCDPTLYPDYFRSVWANERLREETAYVVTWGAPKSFSRKSAEEYRKRFLDPKAKFLSDYRFQIKGDPIVTLPPAWSGYVHVGEHHEVLSKVLDETTGGLFGFGRHFRYSLNTPFMFQYYERADDCEQE